MCYFLTIGVPARQARRMAEAFGRGFQLAPTSNSTILSGFPPGFVASFLTSGGCSCDLYAPPRASGDADGEEHLRRRYTKRGWSEAKIVRAIQQAKSAKPTRRVSSGLRRDVVERLQMLCAAAGKVAIVVHWYKGGDVEGERLMLMQRPPCQCSELATLALTLRKDQVMHATPSG